MYASGDGSQTRAFCYVDDMIEGFLRMMAAPDDITGPMNLGNPVETSVAELAHLIVELTGARSKIVHRPLPVDDPIQRCPDIAQARRALDWEPQTPLRPGLQRTIAFFDNLLAERDECQTARSMPIHTTSKTPRPTARPGPLSIALRMRCMTISGAGLP
jgi:UDP-glucuronate decarboxylase